MKDYRVRTKNEKVRGVGSIVVVIPKKVFFESGEIH
jgi:hypothetical protein